jgi:hypothetical protein
LQRRFFFGSWFPLSITIFLKKRFHFAGAPCNPFLKRICFASSACGLESISIGAIAAARAYFCLAAKEAKRLGDQITICKTTSEGPPRLLAPSLKQFTELFLYARPWAKPLALQARLSRPAMPLFFVVFYDYNLTSRQAGSVYFIFCLLALHEKSF